METLKLARGKGLSDLQRQKVWKRNPL